MNKRDKMNRSIFFVIIYYLNCSQLVLRIGHCYIPMNINGYIPILINMFDTIVRGDNMLTK